MMFWYLGAGSPRGCCLLSAGSIMQMRWLMAAQKDEARKQQEQLAPTTAAKTNVTVVGKRRGFPLPAPCLCQCSGTLDHTWCLAGPPQSSGRWALPGHWGMPPLTHGGTCPRQLLSYSLFISTAVLFHTFFSFRKPPGWLCCSQHLGPWTEKTHGSSDPFHTHCTLPSWSDNLFCCPLAVPETFISVPGDV